jgi:hypothetical protein
MITPTSPFHHSHLYPEEVDDKLALLNKVTSCHTYSTIYKSLQHCFFLLVSVTQDFNKSFTPPQNHRGGIRGGDVSLFDQFMDELFIQSKTKQECINFVDNLLRLTITPNIENFKLFHHFFFNLYLSSYPQKFSIIISQPFIPLPEFEFLFFVKFFCLLTKSSGSLLFDETSEELQLKGVGPMIKKPDDLLYYESFLLTSAFHLPADDDDVVIIASTGTTGGNNPTTTTVIKSTTTKVVSIIKPGCQQTFAMNILLILSGYYNTQKDRNLS